MTMHICDVCPRFEGLAPKERDAKRTACAVAKQKRQANLSTFDREAWKYVKAEVRPILALAWQHKNYSLMHKFWLKYRSSVAYATGQR